MGLKLPPFAWFFGAAWAGCFAGLISPGIQGRAAALIGAVVVMSAMVMAWIRGVPRIGVFGMALAFGLVCAASVSLRLESHMQLESTVRRGEPGILVGRILDVEPDGRAGYAIRLRPQGTRGRADVELLASPAEIQRALNGHPPTADGLIEWPVRLYPYRRPGNPGEFDGWMRAARLGFVARAYFDDAIADPIWAEDHGPVDCGLPELVGLLRALRRLAWDWRCTLLRTLGGEEAAIALGMALGQRDRVSPALRDAFSKAGIAHLLAVSGLHVGFVASLGLILLAPLWRGAAKAGGGAGRALTLIGIALSSAYVFSYVLLVGGPPSALRAGMMTVAALSARLIGRRSDSLQSWGAAGLALLLADPLYAFDLGFQLSFAATAGVLASARICGRLIRRFPRLIRPILWGLALGAGAQGFTLPLAVGTFSLVAWFSPIVNLIAIPLASWAVLAIGGGLALSELYAPLGSLLIKGGGYLIGPLIDAALWVAPWAALEAAAPGRAFIAGWYLALIPLCQLAATAGEAQDVRAHATARRLLVLGVCLIAWTGVSGVHQELKGNVRVWVLDVGQGDAILIVAPWGRSVLIDGGPYGVGGYDAGRDRVVPTLKRLGVRSLDVVISTHPDSDHVGGLATVLRERRVAKVFASWATSTTATYRRFEEAAAEVGLLIERLEAGDRLVLGERVTLNVLAGGSPNEWQGASLPPHNDRSVVVSLENGDSRFLLMGDADERGVRRLMDGFDLNADALLLPHHGSPGTFWSELLDRVSPRFAVVSVGYNSYGHPSPDLMTMLSARGIPAWRTDFCGAVRIDVGPRILAVDAHRDGRCP